MSRRRGTAVAARPPAPRRSGPQLRGLGWGVLALVVLAVVVFASVLVVVGMRDGSLAGGTPTPTIGADSAPRSAAAAWSFDEGSGSTAADAAGQLAGSPLRLRDGAGWTSGMSGTALLLNGKGAYAATAGPVLATANSYTVAAWVRLDEVPGTFVTAVSQDGATDSAFYLQYSDADKRFAFAAVYQDARPVRAVAVTPPVVGRWTHLVGVRDAEAGTVTLWVDGRRQETRGYDLRADSAGPLVVGRAKAGGNPVDFWPGAIDSVTVYGDALSPAQVSDLYRAGR